MVLCGGILALLRVEISTDLRGCVGQTEARAGIKGRPAGDLYRDPPKPKVSFYIVTEPLADSVASSAMLIVRHYERQEGRSNRFHRDATHPCALACPIELLSCPGC
jgi:hypothetical protein